MAPLPLSSASRPRPTRRRRARSLFAVVAAAGVLGVAAAGAVGVADGAPESQPAAVGGGTSGSASPATVGPATAPAYVPTARDLETIAEMERYYAKLYARPLEVEANARLAHLIAVGSLARIDAATTADKLLLIANRGKVDPRVAQAAWEALAARYPSLMAGERAEWLDAGLSIADAGGFPGDSAGPLLAALATRPPGAGGGAAGGAAESAGKEDGKPSGKAAIKAVRTPERNAKAVDALLLRVAEENDPAVEQGRRTLDAAADTLARWADKEVVGRLVRQMGRSVPLSKRIDRMLRRLPNPPAEAGDRPAAVWAKWLATADLGKPAELARASDSAKAADPGKRGESASTKPATAPAGYAGDNSFFVKPDRIVNPKDPKWSAEIELPKLQLAEVNVAFCVDATGSMAESNAYVTAYLEMAVKSLGVISPTIKAGAIYYRHENVKAFMVDCCKTAATQKGNFLVKGMPLTADIPGLVKQMQAQRIEGPSGHDAGGGAYLSAMTSAAELLGPPRKGVARVAIIIGDTFVTHGSEKGIVEAAKLAKEAGLIVVFVVRDQRAAMSVKGASNAASGHDAIVYLPDLGKFKGGGGGVGGGVVGGGGAAMSGPSATEAAEGFVTTAFGRAAERAVTAMVSKGYADRVPPLFRNAWRLLLAEMRAEKAKAALK